MSVSAVVPVVEEVAPSLTGAFELLCEGTEALDALVLTMPSHLLDEKVASMLRPIVRDLCAGLDLLDLGLVGAHGHE